MTPEQAISISEDLIAKGRGYLLVVAPFIAKTLYALTPIPVVGDPRVKTMCVTAGLVMPYNPFFIVSEPSFHTVNVHGFPNGHECVGGCLYHECWHHIRGIWRLEALPDAELANVSGDVVINDDLRTAGIPLPPWVIYPERFGLPKGLTLEQVFARLENNEEVKKLMAQAAMEADDGKDYDEKSGPLKGPCSGQCGGIANNPSDKDLEAEMDAQYGRHEAEKEQIRQSTIRDINEHIEAKGRGSAPGFQVEEIPFKKREFPVDWHKEVSRVIMWTSGKKMAGGADYSYRRPSKRSLLLGIVRPGLVDQQPEVSFVRDTSASMGAVQLNDANNVVISIMRRMGLDQVWLLDADTEVKGAPRLVSIRDIPTIKPKGRGGTSFIQPLEAVYKLKPRPDICIYLTDGDGTAPEHAPKGMPVIWVIVPTTYGRRPADWGHMVVCSNDQKLRKPYYG